MEVILLDKLANLGNLGDTVKVKPGYARNYLLPQGKAVPATPDSIAAFEARRSELEKLQADTVAAAQARAAELGEVAVTIARKAGDEGKLFGSVGAHDIADAVIASGADLKRHEVRLPEGPLRQVGEHDVAVHLHADVDVTIKVNIVPED